MLTVIQGAPRSWTLCSIASEGMSASNGPGEANEGLEIRWAHREYFLKLDGRLDVGLSHGRGAHDHLQAGARRHCRGDGGWRPDQRAIVEPLDGTPDSCFLDVCCTPPAASRSLSPPLLWGPESTFRS